MVSQKRDKLLSDLEKDRLKNRNSLESRTRATNDIRVKRKLSAWLNGIDDVLLILEHLPKEDIQKVAYDVAVIRLATAAIEMMRIMGYHPMVGDVGHPEGWQMITKNWDEIRSGNIATGPATDTDIIRTADLTMLALMLESMLDMANNPVSAAINYKISKDNPAVVDALKRTPEILSAYQKALDRLSEAGKAVIKEREKSKSNKSLQEEPK